MKSRVTFAHGRRTDTMHGTTSSQPSAQGPWGMAASLKTPIAAAGIPALLQYGYELVASRSGSLNFRDGRTRQTTSMAAVKLKLRAAQRPSRDAAPLWRLPEADLYYRYLHEYPQLWVHVDYDGYRAAWIALGMDSDWNQVLTRNTYLDHVQNRDAARLRNSTHPYIRLVPVPHTVNSSAGNQAGGERMECNMLRQQGLQPHRNQLVFADPFDLTKMLRQVPGTVVLPGVNAFHENFFQAS